MDLARQIWNDNPWIVGLVGVAGVVATFVLGGWVAGFVGLGLLALVIIGALLNSVVQLQKKIARGSGDISDPSLAQGSDHDGAVDATAERASESSASDRLVSDQSKEDAIFNETLQAALDRDLKTVTELAPKYLSGAGSDDVEMAKRRELLLMFRSIAGDDGAARELRETFKQRPDAPDLVRLVIWDLVFKGVTGSVSTFLEEGRDVLGGEPLRMVLLAASTEAREALDFIRARNFAMEALGLVDDEEHQTEVQRELARIAEAKGDRLSELVWLERAAASSPLESAVKFDLGYRYSQIGLPELSAFHYVRNLRLEPNARMTLNNLGVTFNALNMPFKGHERFQRSAELGESLAAANLANKYLDIGAIELAQSALDKARSMDDAHVNVFEAEARLKRSAVAEREQMTEVLKRAQLARDAICEMNATAQRELPFGKWRLDSGDILEFEQKPNRSVAVMGSSYSQLTFTVAIEEEALRITRRKGEYSATTDYGWGAAEGDTMRFVLSSGDNHETAVLCFQRE